jgi:hypothetical protein
MVSEAELNLGVAGAQGLRFTILGSGAGLEGQAV